LEHSERLNPGPGTRYRVLTQTLIAALHEVDIRKGKERIYLLVDKLIDRAIVDGDMEAIEYIFDRVDGRLPCAVRLEDEADEPIYEFTLKLGRRADPGDQHYEQDEQQTNITGRTYIRRPLR
jgi:hypothetical protein